jgi:hypothetical protein
MYGLQYQWLLLTPQLQGSIIFICEPLMFLISISGMTRRRDFITLRMRGRNLKGQKMREPQMPNFFPHFCAGDDDAAGQESVALAFQNPMTNA